MTKDYLIDQPNSSTWKDNNTPLFEHCSNLLRFIAPEQWVAMQNLRYTDGRDDKGQNRKRKVDDTVECGKVSHIAGAWSGVAINQGQVLDGEPHWDYRDGRAKFNLAIPYGSWEGGYLVLWGIKKKVELLRGEGLFFLGSLIAHNVVDITKGTRNSLDLFSHQSNFEAYRREKTYTNRVDNWNTGSTVSSTRRKMQRKK